MNKKLVSIISLSILSFSMILGNTILKLCNSNNDNIFENCSEFESFREIKRAIDLNDDSDVLNNGNTASLLCSKLGVQTGTTSEGSKCMRFVLAIRDLNVDVKLKRKITKENGTVNIKTYSLEKAYSAIKMNGQLIEPSEFNYQYSGADYKYFVTYSINGISNVKAAVEANIIVTDNSEEDALPVVINYNAADYAGASSNPGVLRAEDNSKTSVDGIEYKYVIDENGNGKIEITNVELQASGNVASINPSTTITIQNSNLSSDCTTEEVATVLPENFTLPAGVNVLLLNTEDTNNSEVLKEFVSLNEDVLLTLPIGTKISLTSNSNGQGKLYYEVKKDNKGNIILQPTKKVN